jgi:hypothetical protein
MSIVNLHDHMVKHQLLTTLFLFLAQAMAIAQVVDVDTYSGRANTVIPIYTFQSGSLSYPIMLYYNSSGIKAKEFSGPVGVKWGISTGPSIVRSLRGLPDDYSSSGTPAKQGWLINNTCATIGSFTPTADDNLNDCTDEEGDFNFLNSLGGFSGGTIKDTEPDIYYINTPNITGSFTFDNTGQIALITQDDYSVTYTQDANGKITTFKIIDDEGVTYTFGIPRSSSIRTTTSDENAISHFKYQYYLYKTEVVYSSSWRLISMESVNGDKISFEYQPQMSPMISISGFEFPIPSTITENVGARIYNESSGNHATVGQYTIERTIRPEVQFYRIIGRTQRAELKNSSLVIPVGNYSLKQPILSTIGIYDITKSQPVLLTDFELKYEVVDDVEGGNNFFIFLRSLSERSGVISSPPYIFDYYGVNFSNKTLYGSNGSDRREDEFGFLNANAPFGQDYKTYIYPSLTGLDRLRNKPIPGYVGTLFQTSGVGSEGVDFGGLLVGTLSQVTLPGGGANRIFYEPNIYRDALAQSDYYAGGLRVKRLELHDGVNFNNDIIKTYRYEEDNGTSSGVLLYRPLRTFNLNFYKNPQTGIVTYYHDLVSQNLSQSHLWKKTTIQAATDYELNKNSDPGVWVGYKKVTVSQIGAGKTVHEYDIGAPFGTINETGWTATKNKIARDNPTSGTSIIAHDPGPITGYYAFPFAPNPNYDFKQGLPRKISFYNNANTLVEQNENEYTYLTSPLKVYAIKLDQYKAMLTYNVTLNSPQGPVTNTYTNEQPMFVYGRYEVNTKVRPRLLRTTTKTFDQNNPSSFVTNIQNYEYASTVHDLVTKVTKIGSDGVEYATNYKYPKDYTITAAWAQQDNTCKAITKLKEKNLLQPIETWVTKKQGAETPLLVNANLNMFEYDPASDNLYLKRDLSIATRDPLTFTSSSVNNTGGTSLFTFETTKYNVFRDFLHQDAYGNARSILGYDRSKTSAHIDLNTGVPKASITNALADEIVFSDFESTNQYDFVYAGSLVGGRTAGSALNFLSGAANKLTKSLKKGEGQQYVFSCWIKSSASGVITVRVNDGGAHTQVSTTISFTNTAGSWKYYRTTIATGTFNSNVNVEVESNASINLDDAIFYPASASFNTFIYGKGLAKIAETDSRGISTFYEYDDFGKVLYVRDQDQNIIKANTYKIQGAKLVIGKINIYVKNPYLNVPAELWASKDIPGATYKWKIVKLSDHKANTTLIDNFSNAIVVTGSSRLTYTFTEAVAYLVNLQVIYQSSTQTAAYYENVNVGYEPLAASICSNRPKEIDLCNPALDVSGCIPVPSSSLVLKVTVASGSGSYSYEWSRSDYPSQVVGTSSTYSVSSYAFNVNYSCLVKDLISNKSAFLTWDVKVYKSDPNCTAVITN